MKLNFLEFLSVRERLMDMDVVRIYLNLLESSWERNHKRETQSLIVWKPHGAIRSRLETRKKSGRGVGCG